MASQPSVHQITEIFVVCDQNPFFGSSSRQHVSILCPKHLFGSRYDIMAL